jgi:acetyl esterase/lipase
MKHRYAILATVLICSALVFIWSMRYGLEFGNTHFDSITAATAPSPPIVTKLNLSYPDGRGAPQLFNFYAPKDYLSAHYPVLIWLHGGGWAIGDKSDWLSQVVSVKAAGLGFVVFNVNYRLNSAAHPAPYPAASDDVAAFVVFLNQHPEIANSAATTPVSIGGHSAGGQLALYEATSSRSPSHFRCVIDLAGVTDLTSSSLPAALQPYVAAITPTSQQRADASPLRRIADWRADRVLFLHAHDDPIVPIEQSIAMAAALASRPAAPAVVEIFPDQGGHDLSPRLIDDALAAFAPGNCA